jgi:hypothetical protein
VDAEALAADILRRWGDAIAQRDLDALSGQFATDAVFVATAPTPLIGRAAIRAYYAAVPAGLTVVSRLVVALAQKDGLVIVADVVFDAPERGALRGRLCLSCGEGTAIRLYHLGLTSGTA